MNNQFGKFAIVISLAALSLSIWTYVEADVAAGRALKHREQELVNHYTPGVQKMCADFGIKAPQNPKSIDELLSPLVGLITRIE